MQFCDRGARLRGVNKRGWREDLRPVGKPPPCLRKVTNCQCLGITSQHVRCPHHPVGQHPRFVVVVGREALERRHDIGRPVGQAGCSVARGGAAAPAGHVLPADARAVAALPGLEARGLMTMAPFAADGAALRRCFSSLRRLQERLADCEAPPAILSMGMSDDFEVAIEEGATMVRIGRAIVGG